MQGRQNKCIGGFGGKKKLLGIPRCKWKGNIKTDLRKMEWEGASSVIWFRTEITDGFLWNRNEVPCYTKSRVFTDYMMNTGIPVMILLHGVSKWSVSKGNTPTSMMWVIRSCFSLTKVMLMIRSHTSSLNHSMTTYFSGIPIVSSASDCTQTHELNKHFLQTALASHSVYDEEELQSRYKYDTS